MTGTTARCSQLWAEVLIAADSPFLVSNLSAEALIHAASPLVTSRLSAEALIRAASPLVASRVGIEALVAAGLVSKLFAEILVWNHLVTTPPIYPTLGGLGFNVVKRPKAYVGNAVSGSGWQVDIGYAVNPTWEFDLTYDVLPDQPGFGGTTTSDLQTLLGFFLSLTGTLGRFLFLDPDDNSVTTQQIGTTDGTTTNWTLIRTYGGGSGTGTEPVGYVNTSAPFNVYLNGVLQSASTYSVLTTTPVAQVLKFNSAPSAGQDLKVDMSYYYYCKFKDPTYDFEKWGQQLWLLKKVTLASLRG